MVAVLRATALVAVFASVAHADEAKQSISIETDEQGWQHAGFRLGLGLAYGRMEGLRGAPSGRLLGPVLHAGLRLDKDWSLLATFQYQSASASGGLSGLRFSGTVDPTWHVTPHLALSLGLGFGGLVEGSTGRADLAPQATDVSITLPSASPPVPSCVGVGASGLLRAEYMWIIGPHSQTNVSIEALGQYTSCVKRGQTNAVDPDTAQPIIRTQYWPHAGFTVAWGVAWR